MPSTTCGWCGRFANMRQEGTELAIDRDHSFTTVRVMATFKCDYCSRFLLGSTVMAKDSYVSEQYVSHINRFESSIEWLPTRGSQPPAFDDVPEHIRQAAQEAYRCRSIEANRAAVMLARCVVEAAAKARGVTGGNLVQKIDALFDQHIIREHVRDGAHEIRYLGNDMAHGDFVDPVDPDDADLVLALMAEVLEEIFESQARVARAQANRAAKAHARAKRASKAASAPPPS